MADDTKTPRDKALNHIAQMRICFGADAGVGDKREQDIEIELVKLAQYIEEWWPNDDEQSGQQVTMLALNGE